MTNTQDIQMLPPEVLVTLKLLDLVKGSQAGFITAFVELGRADVDAVLRNISVPLSPGDHIAIVGAVGGVDQRVNEITELQHIDMFVFCHGKRRTLEDLRSLLAEFHLAVTTVGRAGRQSIIQCKKLDEET